MNYRNNKRMPVFIPARMLFSNIILMKSIIRNITKKGFFVETNYLDLGILSRIEIIMPTVLGKWQKKRLQGQIIHKGRTGYGVEILGVSTKSTAPAVPQDTINRDLIPLLRVLNTEPSSKNPE